MGVYLNRETQPMDGLSLFLFFQGVLGRSPYFNIHPYHINVPNMTNIDHLVVVVRKAGKV